jgi:hypothetical protein
MKYTGQCTKCNSSDVLEVKGSRYNTYNYIYLNSWGTKYAIIDRYVCVRCGFTEEYVKVDDKFNKIATEMLEKKKVDDGFV